MKFLSTFILIICVSIIHAQNVGIGTPTPDPKAVLDISSTNKGLLMPRLSDTSAVSAPVPAGLTIYNTSDKKMYFYDGTKWQRTSAQTASDNLWYEHHDSILYTDRKYVGVNTNLSLLPPQANLQVTGSLLVQGDYTFTQAEPTPAQTYIMDNTTSQIIPNTDSIFRIFDTGGTSDYLVNTQGNIICNPSINQIAFKIIFNPTDFGIGAGDTLWISETSLPGCRTNYIQRWVNTSSPPNELYVQATGAVNFIFRSNNSIVGPGFDIKVTRIFKNGSNQVVQMIGPGMAYDAINNSFRVGFPSNAAIGSYSTTLGFRTTASGDFSTAMGSVTDASGVHSTAMGIGATASGYSSTAMGSGTAASGAYSTAMGTSTSASNYSSTAIGFSTTASGTYSIAMGRGTIASGFNSTAMGENTTASGTNSTAMGSYTTASGSYSSSMGYLTTASGTNSTAMGNQTTASGYSSTAMGNNTKASGNGSTALGSSTTAKSYSSLAIGQYNDTIALSNPIFWVPSDPLFMIGNGTDYNARSNAMTVLKNGNVGIGPSSPTSKLEVVGTNNASPLVKLTQFGSAAPALKIAASSGNNGGMELENAAIRITGSNKFVFEHICSASTQSGANGTILPNTGFANSSTDLLIITPVYITGGVFVNFTPHAYWSPGISSWMILNPNGTPVPINSRYNVMVIKQ